MKGAYIIFQSLKRFVKSIRDFIIPPGGAAARADTQLALKQVIHVRQAGGIPSRAQLKYLPKLLSEQEKKLALGAIIIILIAGILLVRELINAKRMVVPAIGGEYTEGLIGMPQMINPLYSVTNDADADIARLVFSGLMTFDTQAGLIPDLAESYTVSEDGKIYTFVLRKNALWHDGERVLADDVIFTISAIQNPEYRSPLQGSFAEVSVEQINENTVSFTLSEPFAPFLSFLTVGILPSHLWQQIAPVNATLTELNRKPIGSGAYKFEKLVRDSSGSVRTYTLERNPDYYGGAPYLETINFKFFQDVRAGVEALNNHAVEGISYIPIESLSTFEKDGRISLHTSYLNQYTALFFNQKQQTILQSDDIREALALGTDKQAIIDLALYGHGRISDSFLLPGMVGYTDTQSTTYNYNPGAAMALLDSEGWTFAQETISEQSESGQTEQAQTATIRSKDGVMLNFELVTLESSELIQTAAVIQSQWAKLGITITVRTVSPADFQNDILKNRNYDILLSGERYGVDSDPYAFWHSSQVDFPGLNLSLFADADADDNIEDGRSALTLETRASAYEDLQKIVAEELPALFLYQPSYPFAVAKNLKGVEIQYLFSPSDRFSKINLWHTKTRKIFSRLTQDTAETQNQETPLESTPTDAILDTREEF